MPAARTIYFAHGFASSFEADWGRTGWVDILEDSGVEAISLALPGHGDPKASSDPASYVNYEGKIWEQIRGEAPISAVGFSQGADLLLRVASTHPEAFDRLVLIGLGDRALHPSPAADLIEALLGESEPEDLRLRVFWRLAESNASPRAALAAFLARDRQPLLSGDLTSISLPVLSLVGSQENLSQEELARAMPSLTQQVVQGVDHFGLPANFDVIDAALTFLNLSAPS
jgi:pimeloyl-ACP methyl ester carboxylesterase